MNISSTDASKFVLALIVAAIVAWALSYHTFEFNGGLGIRNSGFFSYPRYSAQIGEVPLWKEGRYQYTVRGLPPGPLDLVLQALGATDADAAQLTSFSTTLTASVMDNSGSEICRATGNLADARNGNRSTWVLTSSPTSASFWEPRCQRLPISRFKTYTIVVTVSGVVDSSVHKMLMATLQGGGNELP
jgi:hypothetical protein